MLERNPRPRIALIAMDLVPTKGSEGGAADKWLRALSERFLVDAFVHKRFKERIRAASYGAVNFIFIDLDGPFLAVCERAGLFNVISAAFARRTMRILRSHVRTQEYSLIHCVTPAGVYAHNSYYELGIPVLVGPLGGGLDEPAGFRPLFRAIGVHNRLRNIFYALLPLNPAWRRYFARASLILIGTDVVAERLPANVRENCLVVFDTTVDTEVFRPLARARSGAVRIVYVGRLEVVKGCRLLLDAFASLVRSGVLDHPVDLVFYGSGSQEDSLRRAISDQGLGDLVSLAGYVDHASLPAVLGEADVFCLPTLREPGGGAILEAMACGLPVITTDYGGPAFSVTEECGFKITPESPEQYVRDLAAALTRLVSDRALRERMGTEGRMRAVEHFSEPALRRRIDEIYAMLIPPSPYRDPAPRRGHDT